MAFDFHFRWSKDEIPVGDWSVRSPSYRRIEQWSFVLTFSLLMAIAVTATFSTLDTISALKAVSYPPFYEGLTGGILWFVHPPPFGLMRFWGTGFGRFFHIALVTATPLLAIYLVRSRRSPALALFLTSSTAIYLGFFAMWFWLHAYQAVVHHDVTQMTLRHYVSIPLITFFASMVVSRVALPIVDSCQVDHAVEATKPVEPTGISSSPSDLITSHTSGDSPGGSLRR